MLDKDLAELYQVEVKVLNQAVKRNIKRFPSDFMFQLTKEEWNNLKSQFVTSSWGGTRKLPYAFTEQGLAMLSGILSLNVGRSLVQNKGFDGTGTNCSGGGLYDSVLWLQPLPVERISPVAENAEARRCLARYYHRTNCFRAKALRRIMRTLKGDFGA